MHEMQPIAIDDPVTWASVSLSLFVCHVGEYLPHGTMMRLLIHYCRHLLVFRWPHKPIVSASMIVLWFGSQTFLVCDRCWLIQYLSVMSSDISTQRQWWEPLHPSGSDGVWSPGWQSWWSSDWRLQSAAVSQSRWHDWVSHRGQTSDSLRRGWNANDNIVLSVSEQQYQGRGSHNKIEQQHGTDQDLLTDG